MNNRSVQRARSRKQHATCDMYVQPQRRHMEVLQGKHSSISHRKKTIVIETSSRICCFSCLLMPKHNASPSRNTSFFVKPGYLDVSSSPGMTPVSFVFSISSFSIGPFGDVCPFKRISHGPDVSFQPADDEHASYFIKAQLMALPKT